MLMCMYFDFMHNQGEVVHPYKHGPCAMVGVLVAKRIHAISTHATHDVPCIICEISIFGIECSPLASIREVSRLQIISVVGLHPLRVLAHELCLLRIYEIKLQTESDC